MHYASCLSFFLIFGRITTHNIAQINIITPSHVYYKIVQLTLQYEYPITVIFLNKLFEIFKIYHLITTYNLIKINIITPRGAYSKIIHPTSTST